MRYIVALSIITSCLFWVSCKKETQAPTVSLNEMVDTTAVLKHSGTFIKGPYGTTSGTAEIYSQGTDFIVKLSDFQVSNGPSLHVFLSKEAMPINAMDLGSLKSVNGNQIYSITGTPDFAEYQYISIHCVQYNHLFGSAKLN